ncbi:MAG TPA: aminotransferase class I/II-fold pyridoxal phosphate-dependent enzyme [Clostridiales bacterium]|jgi:DNA-binding transcriptional MocR family regulator|nr:aminotransferase class I/II-fold pyridoxal phosphate-dependent enzyme [Clostridiales bacterium]HOJ35220.1 aminotransferase class I/II-fold pyridoxal phosphate-dependent enzyme [Clostridiales bacterium]HPP67979.1 aminotransferase class I/II-fold pyridoxal phosphate-dependent enzyme [Clostridiales bacterium]HPU67526.1 aminotransferase class I/II-fold pyridoxal phosphate-dependent enzyme [Clostridiales bacterium]HQA05988.1 aminotransferase class I/II-fold pyridoxal phosphate-dependent enzyme [C
MKALSAYSREELLAFEAAARKQYEEFLSQNLSIDMSRGKPCTEQLCLSDEILNNVNKDTGFKSANGTECRNYGVPAGIDECRQLFADILEVKPENIFVGGNSSLNLMFDYVAQCMLKGPMGEKGWCYEDEVIFLCPAPGYDRHFSICEYFGIKMVNVPMLSTGPDMDVVEELVKNPKVKGMFCVPKYSNPMGITFSDETVIRFAKLKPAAKDFRVIWDNAYCVHDLYDEGDKLLNILAEAEKYGNEDHFVVFTSTSKITYPGAGVSALASSVNNIKAIMSRVTMQTIGHDKINQLRHARAFKDLNGIKEHMKLHAKILAPKFEAVLDILSEELEGLEIASWNKPRGGYFISLDIDCGSAKYVGQLCKEAGLVLTPVGATFPYGVDPEDKNIRIAPTFPPVDELKLCCRLLCCCVKLAAAKELLEKA